MTRRRATLESRELTRAEKKIYAPVTDDEIRQLIDLLQPVPVEDGSATMIRGMTQKAKISHERTGVLLDDVTSVLAWVHAREGLELLGATKDVSRQDRVWMETRMKAVLDCIPQTFGTAGGKPAFEASRAVVERHRTDLEAILLETPRSVPEKAKSP